MSLLFFLLDLDGTSIGITVGSRNGSSRSNYGRSSAAGGTRWLATCRNLTPTALFAAERRIGQALKGCLERVAFGALLVRLG